MVGVALVDGLVAVQGSGFFPISGIGEDLAGGGSEVTFGVGLFTSPSSATGMPSPGILILLHSSLGGVWVEVGPTDGEQAEERVSPLLVRMDVGPGRGGGVGLNASQADSSPPFPPPIGLRSLRSPSLMLEAPDMTGERMAGSFPSPLNTLSSSPSSLPLCWSSSSLLSSASRGGGVASFSGGVSAPRPMAWRNLSSTALGCCHRGPLASCLSSSNSSMGSANPSRGRVWQETVSV